jgi:hypothetical protein
MSKESKFISAMLHSGENQKSEWKICLSCGEKKEVNNFSKNPKNADGRCTSCKPCRLKTASATYHKRKAERDFYKSMMPI